jgi:hypothetical protein
MQFRFRAKCLSFPKILLRLIFPLLKSSQRIPTHSSISKPHPPAFHHWSFLSCNSLWPQVARSTNGEALLWCLVQLGGGNANWAELLPFIAAKQWPKHRAVVKLSAQNETSLELVLQISACKTQANQNGKVASTQTYRMHLFVAPFHPPLPHCCGSFESSHWKQQARWRFCLFTRPALQSIARKHPSPNIDKLTYCNCL